MHRFFVPSALVASSEAVVLPAEQAHQIHTVLRLRSGDSVLLLDDTGWVYELTLNEVSRQRVAGVVVDKRPSPGEPSIQLTLYQSLLKRDKFEWVLQKGTEVGVAHFVPLLTERSLVQETAVKSHKQQRWQRILTEAAEQSGRGRIPTLADPVPFHTALAGLSADVALMGTLAGERVSLAQALTPAGFDRVALFIGPEGEFSPAEVALAQQCGVTAVSLGPRILRTETAAIVAAALVLHELGEWVIND